MTFLNITRYFFPILLHNSLLRVKFFVTHICLLIILSVIRVGVIENRDLTVKYKILKMYIKKKKKYFREKEVIENLRISGIC
jgi:hypothetical protein